MEGLQIPVDLIWGEKDPWEPLQEARRWEETISCIQSIHTIPNTGHCPHDECPSSVNPILINMLRPQIKASTC